MKSIREIAADYKRGQIDNNDPAFRWIWYLSKWDFFLLDLRWRQNLQGYPQESD